MGPEGHARLARADRECAGKLQEEPQAQQEHGRQTDKADEHKDPDEDNDIAPGIEHQIGAQDAGDGPARAEHRHLACGIYEGLG
jgi:hypothetical protein